MADILKISTPMIDRNPVQQNKQVADSGIPFQMTDVGRVVKPNPQSELLNQNNGMLQKEEAPTLLLNLLKDPSVTVNFLKNICMLQEIIKLLPVNNSTTTQGIHQLFNQLMMRPEDIVSELMRQEQTSTVFKGELFDLLRQLLAENPKPEMRYGVANLLKSLNALLGKNDILDSLSNSLTYLADTLHSSRSLHSRLSGLSEQFRQADAAEQFAGLKNETLALLKEVEESILFSPKLSKILPLIVYNLSRFNDNPDYLQEAISSMLTLIDGKQQRAELMGQLRLFFSEGVQRQSRPSQVMDVLAKLLGEQAADEQMTLVNADKIERIIHSLLSSPCNFTPLLHFIIPVQDMDMKSFAEIWIDPNSAQEHEGTSGVQESVHMLIVFDIDGIGQFEAELFVVDRKISLSLLCPTTYLEQFSRISSVIPKVASGTQYTFSDIKIDKLERQRSLMDVFKALPYKRTGIDVKV